MMTKEILIKSAIKLLVNEQVKQGSWGYALETDSDYEVSWKDVLKWLEQQPKTGHWSKKTKVDAYDIAGVKTWGIECQCDRCNFTTIVIEDFGYYNFCPNCGAKMENEDEG